MKLIASDHTKVVYYDTETGDSKVLHSGQGVYYGITWDDLDNLYLAVSNSLKLLHLNDASKQVTGVIEKSTSEGKKTSSPFMSSPHQIFWKHGLLYVADTGRNRLTMVSETDLENEGEVKVTEADWDKVNNVQTGVHVNSVYITANSKYLYMLAHGADNPSFYQKYDYERLKLLEEKELKANWAHNIALIDGKLLICNSKGSSLIDGISNKVLWKPKDDDSLTRGLCVTDDRIYVGRSPRASRADRTKFRGSSGGFWTLDRKTYKELDYTPIPNLTHINEMRVLDLLDYAHNGIIFNSENVYGDN